MRVCVCVSERDRKRKRGRLRERGDSSECEKLLPSFETMQQYIRNAFEKKAERFIFNKSRRYNKTHRVWWCAAATNCPLWDREQGCSNHQVEIGLTKQSEALCCASCSEKYNINKCSMVRQKVYSPPWKKQLTKIISKNRANSICWERPSDKAPAQLWTLWWDCCVK